MNSKYCRMKLGIVTGVTGQDGSYLTELLLEKGYDVWGVIRPSSNSSYERTGNFMDASGFTMKRADLRDTFSLQTMFDDLKTSLYERIEVYNLAAQSHVRHSFDMPEYTADVDALGVLRILECIRRCPEDLRKKIRFYQASTSELYGNRISEEGAGIRILNETSGFEPCSPYAVSKLFAFWSVKNYREGYGLFACNGILFNHESPRRGVEFVTRKITTGLAKICKGEQEYVSMGNLDARRDWGHARDYVEGMWRILQVETAEDWVLATGQNHSVRDFIIEAFRLKGFILQWRGQGVEEEGVDQMGIVRVKIHPDFFRPNELHTLLGDAQKARDKLGWIHKTTFEELVKEMVDVDCEV